MVQQVRFKISYFGRKTRSSSKQYNKTKTFIESENENQ